jgi:hypothetical protein
MRHGKAAGARITGAKLGPLGSAPSLPSRASRRQVVSREREMPCACAVAETSRGPAKLDSTIRSRSAALHRRRRPSSTTSNRDTEAILRQWQPGTARKDRPCLLRPGKHLPSAAIRTVRDFGGPTRATVPRKRWNIPRRTRLAKRSTRRTQWIREHRMEPPASASDSGGYLIAVAMPSRRHPKANVCQ